MERSVPGEVSPQLNEVEPGVNLARRFGRRILSIFPQYRNRRAVAPEEELSSYAVVEDPAELQRELEPLGEIQGQPVVITLVDGLNTFEFTDETGEEVFPAVKVHRHSASRLHGRLTKMYLLGDAGEHSGQDVAGLLEFQARTISRDSKQLGTLLPKEVFNYEETSPDDLRLWIGNIALATRKPNEQDIAELDKGKTDLTAADHAIVTKGESRYYIPFDSTESILAIRVIEALQDFNKVGANTDDVSQAVWRNMTVAERRLFLEDPAYAFGEAEQVQDEVLSVLRKLTNRLMLTLEPSGQKFTVNSEDLTVEAHDRPVDLSEYSDARLVAPPGQELIIELLPDHLDMARDVLQAVRAGDHLEDAEAIRILDFVTSVAGRRAIAEVFEPTEGMRSQTTALKAIHKLLKLNLGEGYAAARRNRTVSGNRIIRGGRSVKQVSGRLPITTKWHIGRPIGETFEK